MLISWMSKVSAKMGGLSEWEKGVFKKLSSMDRCNKNNLADQIKQSMKANKE